MYARCREPEAPQGHAASNGGRPLTDIPCSMRSGLSVIFRQTWEDVCHKYAELHVT